MVELKAIDGENVDRWLLIYINRVADEHGVEIAPQCIKGREKRVRNGLEILVAKRGQHDAMDTVPFRRPCFAAIDPDLMSALDEPCPQLRGEGLEAAVVRWDTAGAEYGESSTEPPGQLAVADFAARFESTRRLASTRARLRQSQANAGSDVRSIVSAASEHDRDRARARTARCAARDRALHFSGAAESGSSPSAC